MDLYTYVSDLGMPPKIGRGIPKRSTTITLTEHEDDIVTYLAGSLPTLFDKKKSEVVRAALHHYIWELEDLVDNEWKPIIQQLKDNVRRTNYLQSKDAIAEMLDRKADMFNTQLDFGELDGALYEYDIYLNEVHQLPPWWQKIVHSMAGQHPEMQRFMTRIDRMGFEAVTALKALMEKDR